MEFSSPVLLPLLLPLPEIRIHRVDEAIFFFGLPLLPEMPPFISLEPYKTEVITPIDITTLLHISPLHLKEEIILRCRDTGIIRTKGPRELQSSNPL